MAYNHTILFGFRVGNVFDVKKEVIRSPKFVAGKVLSPAQWPSEYRYNIVHRTEPNMKWLWSEFYERYLHPAVRLTQSGYNYLLVNNGRSLIQNESIFGKIIHYNTYLDTEDDVDIFSLRLSEATEFAEQAKREPSIFSDLKIPQEHLMFYSITDPS